MSKRDGLIKATDSTIEMLREHRASLSVKKDVSEKPKEKKPAAQKSAAKKSLNFVPAPGEVAKPLPQTGMLDVKEAILNTAKMVWNPMRKSMTALEVSLELQDTFSLPEPPILRPHGDQLLVGYSARIMRDDNGKRYVWPSYAVIKNAVEGMIFPRRVPVIPHVIKQEEVA